MSLGYSIVWFICVSQFTPQGETNGGNAYYFSDWKFRVKN